MNNSKKQDLLAQEIFNNATNTPSLDYENSIRDTVILKKIMVRNGEDFYKRVRINYFPELRTKYNFSIQLISLFISVLFSALLYHFWDHNISLIWYGVCAALIVSCCSVSGIALKSLFLQKDFDKFLQSLRENKEDRKIFIEGIKNNLFMESSFTDKDFTALFDNPYTKESAIIREGVMQEVEFFFKKYLTSVVN